MTQAVLSVWTKYRAMQTEKASRRLVCTRLRKRLHPRSLRGSNPLCALRDFARILPKSAANSGSERNSRQLRGPFGDLFLGRCPRLAMNKRLYRKPPRLGWLFARDLTRHWSSPQVAQLFSELESKD